ncbi:hypothetical protein [Agaribacterium sp. ZY112]|uniref:hypothetical protein n=1 Tax=Agaribacterium sp. ZY112 TaxID=3233574 RepID=UPI003523E900
MNKIELQSLTKAEHGRVDVFWHEDKAAGMARTLYHRITIPLSQFKLDIEGETKAIDTELVFDWYDLDLGERYALNGLNLTHEAYPEAEGSLMINDIDNWCDVKRLAIEETAPDEFKLTGELIIEFEEGGLAENTSFSFETTMSAERG